MVSCTHELFDIINRHHCKHAHVMTESNAVVFMVDATTGVTDLDEAMADVLRRSKKPVFLAVNKVDNHERFLEALEAKRKFSTSGYE